MSLRTKVLKEREEVFDWNPPNSMYTQPKDSGVSRCSGTPTLHARTPEWSGSPKKHRSEPPRPSGERVCRTSHLECGGRHRATHAGEARRPTTVKPCGGVESVPVEGDEGRVWGGTGRDCTGVPWVVGTRVSLRVAGWGY